MYFCFYISTIQTKKTIMKTCEVKEAKKEGENDARNLMILILLHNSIVVSNPTTCILHLSISILYLHLHLDQRNNNEVYFCISISKFLSIYLKVHLRISILHLSLSLSLSRASLWSTMGRRRRRSKTYQRLG